MVKNVFNKICTAIHRSTMSDYERYLHSATDLEDLERRMRYGYNGWAHGSSTGIQNLLYVRGY